MTNDNGVSSVPVSIDTRRHSSNSEVQVFKRCRRKWVLAYGFRIMPHGEVSEGPLWIGTLVHIGHDARFKALKHGASDAASIKCCFLAIKSVVHRRVLRGIQLDWADVELACIMLAGYWEWEAEEGLLDEFSVLDTEREMEHVVTLPSGEIVVYLGKADVLARNRITNYLWIIDKKTVGSLADPAYGLQRNEQMLGYLMLLEHDDLTDVATEDELVYPEGAVFSMLRKVKRTAKANPPFYGRVEVRYNQTERQRYLRRLQFVMQDIMDLRDRVTPFIDMWVSDGDTVSSRRGVASELGLVEATTIAYPTPTADCSWDCQYIGICDMFNDGSRIADAVADNFEDKDPLARYVRAPHLEG